jgi:hypothetical protein
VVGESEDIDGLTFDPVWMILERPRPNLNPGRFLAPGKLRFEGKRAEFGSSEARLRLGPSPKASFSTDQIVEVSLERYGWGLVPRFVAIEYRTADGKTDVAYFNDAEWNGWRPLLTGVNRRMVETIKRHLGLE